MIYCSLLLIIDSSSGRRYKMQTFPYSSQKFMSFILLHKFYKVEENGVVKTDLAQPATLYINAKKKKRVEFWTECKEPTAIPMSVHVL